MPKKDLVTKVWIEEGCIVCDACETAAPDVFEVLEETCIIRPDAMKVDFTKPRTQNIEDAAEECPVDVIKFETASFEVSAEEAAAAEAAAKDSEAVPSGEVDPAPSPAAASPVAPAVAAKRGVAANPGVAADADPTLAALLTTANARGGAAMRERNSAVIPDVVAEWRRVAPEKLPPDIRHARTLEIAAQSAAKEQEREQKEKTDPDRRTVIGSIALGAGWAAFGGATAISAGPAFTRFLMPNVLEEPDPKVRVGSIEKYSEMPPNDVNEDFKPQGVWMIRQEGQIAALNIICTHLGCIPNWLPNDRKFKCPCHGSGFKPSGINFEGPAPRPLERFKILEVEGQIIVDKSKKFQYERGDWSNPDSFVAI